MEKRKTCGECGTKMSEFICSDPNKLGYYECHCCGRKETTFGSVIEKGNGTKPEPQKDKICSHCGKPLNGNGFCNSCGDDKGEVEKADNPPRCYVCSEVLIDGVCPNKCDIDVVIKKAKEKADNGLTAENTMIKYFTQDAELYKDNPDARVSLKLIKDCAKEVEREVKAQYKASLLENYNKIIILDFDCAEHCSAELCPLMPRLAEVKFLIEGDL